MSKKRLKTPSQWGLLPTDSVCYRSVASSRDVSVSSSLSAAETHKWDDSWLSLFLLISIIFRGYQQRSDRSYYCFQQFPYVYNSLNSCWIPGFLRPLVRSGYLPKQTFLHRVLAKSSALVLHSSENTSSNKSKNYCNQSYF